MAWQPYIDKLIDLHECQDAAICGINPFSLWASFQDGDFKNIKKEQVECILNDHADIATQGVMLGNRKFTVLNNYLKEENILQLKVKSNVDCEKCNATIHKLEKLLIVVEATQQPGAIGRLNMEVEKIIKYLKASNF